MVSRGQVIRSGADERPLQRYGDGDDSDHRSSARSPERYQGAAVRQPLITEGDWTDVADKQVGTARMITLGFVIIILFFGAGLLWAGLAPLSSGAIAQGVVSVAGNRKTIQHLEGGIVEALHVQEGDSVRVGEILIQLNDTQARTTLDLLRTQYAALKLQEARLQAELTDQPTMHFSFEGVEIADSQTVQQIFHDQLDIFASRRAKLENQVGLLQQRISLQNLEIKGLEAQIDSSRKQLGLIRQELVTVQDLVDRGLATRSRMFALQREEAGLEAGVVQQETQIAATAGAIQEVKAQIADLYAARFEQAAVEILEARDKLAEVQERLPAARETFERTQLLAPISGRVVNLKVHTIGGVIAPGTPVLDIVPDDDQLVIEAHLDPKDRDVIAAGMPAEVRFTAFNQRVSMPVKGRVAWISADSIVDERTGLHHYVARVELIEDPARALKGGAVYPGMQANVMIVAGEKTALSYLFRPLAQMMTGAFREQ